MNVCVGNMNPYYVHEVAVKLSFSDSSFGHIVTFFVYFSGLKLLQLMSDHAAVALNYGIFRRDEFKETAMYVMFFDMGSSSTKASVVEYKVDKITENGRSETHPHLFIRGFGYDRTLGGSEFDFRLREHLAEQFSKSKKTSVDIKDSPKAMSKLLKESTRVKQVLSANTEHYAQVEGLHEENDFKYLVKRELFDELCSDLYDRVGGPIEMALKMADLTLDSIDSFIVFGGSFRIPKIQEKLAELLNGKEISKNVNADEAAALGAVYQAAHLSSAFRVKRFVVKDASVFPIDVSFDRLYIDEQDGAEKIKSVDRTIFNKMNIFPVKKAMTFNRMADDFSFLVKYSNLDFLSDTERNLFSKTHLLNVAISGVRDAYDKNMKEENVTDKGVKAHFRLSDSGMLEILAVDSHFEKKVLEEVNKPAEKSTYEKLSESISSFFSSKTDEKAPENATETKEGSENGESTGDKKEEEGADEKPEPTGSEETPKAEGDTKASEEAANKTTSDEAAKEETVKKVEEKTVQHSETLKFDIEIKDLPPMTETAIKESKDKLLKLTLRDLEKLATAKALNDLESFIIGQQEKLDTNENFIKVTTEEERQTFTTMLSAASDWLYDEGIGLTSKEYKTKLGDLKKEFKGVTSRLHEMTERPKILKAVDELLNRTQTFLNISSALPEDMQIFTAVEIETLTKAFNNTITFVNETTAAIEASSPHEMPPVLVADISVKLRELERELGYLVNKMRYSKPKPKPTTAKPTKSSDNASSDSTGSQSPDVEEDMEPETPEKDEKKEEEKKPETLELPGSESEATSDSGGESSDDPTPNPEL